MSAEVRDASRVPEASGAGSDANNEIRTSSWRSRFVASIIRATGRPLFAVASALVLLIVIFTIVNGSTFASVSNFRNIAVAAAVGIILAVGVTYVIITAGFDLSVGSVLVFSGVVSVKAMTATGGHGWGTAMVGLVVAVAAGAAWGVINGLLVAFAKLNPIIVTLGTLGAALGLAQVITNGQDYHDVPNVMLEFGSARIAGVPWLVVIALGVASVAGIVLSWTAFGRHTYAIGSSKEASLRAGLKVNRHLIVVYMLSGLLAGFAGWLSLAVYGTTNISGHSLDALNAATAALLGGVSLYGGVGTVFGATLGTFIPVALSSGLVIAGLQSFWQQVVTGVVLITAVYLDRLRRNNEELGR